MFVAGEKLLYYTLVLARGIVRQAFDLAVGGHIQSNSHFFKRPACIRDLSYGGFGSFPPR
jgi:hypothetical protein